ncbi:MAG: TrkA family potassium uptake protein [Bacteriovoracaceae bacterium]|nr:TrkA family potassium uptake protein [Bacteriovoracaceae bacterium]
MIVAVIGLGSFGFKTATRLYERGIDVLAIDLDSELVERVKDRVTHAVSINITDERSLRALNISDIDLAIVAIGDNIEMSIMAVASLRKLGVGRVIARAANQIHEHVLRDIGASEIIKVEEEMGDLVASRILAPHILNHFYFAAGYSLVEIKAGKLFEGKTIVEAKIKQNYSLNVVAIQKRVPYITDEGKTAFKVEINDTPMPMDLIEEDDVLVLVGADQNFDRLFQDIGK